MRSIKHYRAFQIDPDGHVFGCINLVCDNDEQAKCEAASLVLLHRIELWRLTGASRSSMCRRKLSASSDERRATGNRALRPGLVGLYRPREEPA